MTTIGFKSFADAMADFNKLQKKIDQTSNELNAEESPARTFSETLNASLKEVNSMQSVKNQMIKSFASGENQNVHELMITLQKAGLAVNMTSAVRNKVLEAYKELSRIQF